MMKNLVYIATITLVAIMLGCKSSSKPVAEKTPEKAIENSTTDTIRIANPNLQYEVIIIDHGFNSWLQSTARPRGYYSQNYMENRNIPWVVEWNNRVRSPKSRIESQLFMLPIDYQNGTDYGYEVNYMLYNYLVYFQLKNNIRLGGFSPHP